MYGIASHHSTVLGTCDLKNSYVEFCLPTPCLAARGLRRLGKFLAPAESSDSESDDEVLVGDHLGTAVAGKDGGIRHDLIVLRNANSDKPTSYAIPIPDAKPAGATAAAAGAGDGGDGAAAVVVKGSKLGGAVKGGVPGTAGYQTFAPKSHRHPMFPHTEERIKCDDYGQIMR